MKRKLQPEERELWDQVARSAIPLQGRQKPKAAPALNGKTAPERPSAKPAKAAVQPFTIGSKAATAAPPSSAAEPAPAMDAKAFSKLKRGRIAPEGRIDLHGMTVAEAHPELVNFILRSHQKARRLVLVITGKGEGPGPSGPLPYQRGILRRQVPYWLQQAPIGNLILQVTPASPKHGGNGALYVYLKRKR